MDEIGCDCSFQELLVLETIQNERDICLEIREKLCEIQLPISLIFKRHLKDDFKFKKMNKKIINLLDNFIQRRILNNF